METLLEAYIQCHDNLYLFYEEAREKCEKIIEYIIDNQNQITFDMWNFGVCQADIELLKNIDTSSYDEDIKKKLEKEFNSKFPIIKIKMTVNISDYKDEIFMNEIKEVLPDDNTTYEELNLIISKCAFKKRLCDLVVAANLACPGSLRIVKGVVIQDLYRVTDLDKMDSMFFKTTLEYCSKYRYPPIIKIDFYKTWQWINKFKMYLNGFSRTKIERALNCFYLLFEKNEPENLFYSIMGTEALYVKGTGGLQEQVKSKCEAFLGVQHDFKKVYTNMYDFRSRFIHGDLNFPIKHNYCIDDRLPKFNKSMQEATYFSIGLLTASLQKLLILDKDDLDFEIKVVE